MTSTEKLNHSPNTTEKAVAEQESISFQFSSNPCFFSARKEPLPWIKGSCPGSYSWNFFKTEPFQDLTSHPFHCRNGAPLHQITFPLLCKTSSFPYY